MTTHIAYGLLSNAVNTPAIEVGTITGGESMSESGTSTATAAAAAVPNGRDIDAGRLVARVTLSSDGTSIYAGTGTVTAANGIRIQPGQTEFVSISPGQKISIKTV